jgi:ribulose-phosphate 3-epimerase
MPIILSASILSANFAHLEEQIHSAEINGVDWIHIDVMDGHFVPSISMGPFIVKTCRRITQLPLDVHLMTEKPEKFLDEFAEAGANYLSVQIEACPHIYHTLQTIRSLGCHPGVVLNPGTPIESISEVLHLVDYVLIMTVNPGASGQKFLPEVVSKIHKLGVLLEKNHSSVMIEVDGGITPETLPLAFEAGARVFVSASSIFKNPLGIGLGIQSLRERVRE